LKLKNNNFFAKTSLENIELPQENDTSNFNKLAKDFYNDLMDLLIINEQVYEKSETELKKFIYDLDLLCQRYFTLVPSDSFQ
jgi:hypothetical protein